MTIGDRIKKARERKNISRMALARACGLAYSTIADLENGYQQSTTKLHKVAAALGMSVEELESGAAPAAAQERPAVAMLNEREEELLRLFRAASPAVKRAIEGAAGKAQDEPPSSPKPSRHV